MPASATKTPTVTLRSRSAVDTIVGYFYQFDHSILRILTAPSATDHIAIECVEDIDLITADGTTAIQCKYYSGSEYNNSLIKDAIMSMLTHYHGVKKEAGSKIRYQLWGHYKSGQDKLLLPLSVDYLKDHFLTYKENKVQHLHHMKLGLKDDELKDFIACLSINVKAASYDAQYASIMDALKITFNCSPFVAEFYFYNSALAVVRALAMKPREADRSISKGDFLKRIDSAKLLFHEWFIERKGRQNYFSEIRREIFAPGLNLSPFERFFIMEIKGDTYQRSSIKQLAFQIANKYSKLSKLEPDSFCPYLMLNGLDRAELVALKGELIAEGFRIVDGFDFDGAAFNPTSLCQKATNANGIKLRIVNDIDCLTKGIDAMPNKTRIVYQFFFERPFFVNDNKAVDHHQIQIRSLDDIKAIV